MLLGYLVYYYIDDMLPLGTLECFNFGFQLKILLVASLHMGMLKLDLPEINEGHHYVCPRNRSHRSTGTTLIQIEINGMPNIITGMKKFNSNERQ